MTDISQARQALRDYAREECSVHRTLTGVFTKQPYEFVAGRRGELAGKAFVTTQAALTVAEELRAEAEAPVNPNLFDWQAAGIELVKQAQRDAADRIEAAIWEALT